MQSKANVISNTLCCGCGVCATVCPSQCLEMITTGFGEHRPKVDAARCVNCGQCLRTCPFLGNNPNEDVIGEKEYAGVSGIQYHADCGYFLHTYVGHSPTHRTAGASGGLATWFLEHALTDGVVDAVACVGAGESRGRLLDYRLVTSITELRNCAGSSYYPVEISRLLRHIRESEHTCAVVGLPCVIKAIRLACLNDRRLAVKIRLTVALVCGHLPSKALPDFLSLCMGHRASDLRQLSFRRKEVGKSNLNIQLTYADGSTVISEFAGLMGTLFLNKLFTQPACDCCDDIFGECADIAFMDAWLPEYAPVSHQEGMSLALVRSSLADELLVRHRDGQILDIGIDRVIASQHPRIIFKRQGLYLRLHQGNRYGLRRVDKRVSQPRLSYALQYWIEACIDRRARQILRDTWPGIDNSHERALLLYRRIQGQLRWKSLLRMPGIVLRIIDSKMRRLFGR